MLLVRLPLPWCGRAPPFLVKAKRDEWTSDISEKTLASLDIGFFTFPFKAGTIQIDDKAFHYSYSSSCAISGGHPDPIFSLFHHSGGGTVSLNIDANKRIGDVMEGWDEKNKEMVYAVLSILLYISTYKKDKRRVLDGGSDRSQGSNKKKIPKHQLHYINLRQIESFRGGLLLVVGKVIKNGLFVVTGEISGTQKRRGINPSGLTSTGKAKAEEKSAKSIRSKE